MGQVEAHDAVVRVEQGRVGGEVGRRARVGLHVDAPLGRVQVEGVQSALDAQPLVLVDHFIATVVPGAAPTTSRGEQGPRAGCAGAGEGCTERQGSPPSTCWS